MESYVTADEAAEVLGVSGRYVRKLLTDGQLPGIKRGGAWWVKRTDLDRFQALEPGTPGHPRTLRKRR